MHELSEHWFYGAEGGERSRQRGKGNWGKTWTVVGQGEQRKRNGDPAVVESGALEKQLHEEGEEGKGQRWA